MKACDIGKSASAMKTLKRDHWNESYWAVFSCGSLYHDVRGDSNFEFVHEILKCKHFNESYWAVFSCDPVYYDVQVGSNLWVCAWNPKVWPFNWKLLSSTFLWCWLLCCTRWFLHSCLWMKSQSVTIQLKATEQSFPVVLIIMRHKVVLRFVVMQKIL